MNLRTIAFSGRLLFAEDGGTEENSGSKTVSETYAPLLPSASPTPGVLYLDIGNVMNFAVNPTFTRIMRRGPVSGGYRYADKGSKTTGAKLVMTAQLTDWNETTLKALYGISGAVTEGMSASLIGRESKPVTGWLLGKLGDSIADEEVIEKLLRVELTVAAMQGAENQIAYGITLTWLPNALETWKLPNF